MTAPKVKKNTKAQTPTTHLLVIVDQSGSMGGKEHAVVSGVNEIINTAKQDVAKGGSKVTVSLLRLDSVVLPHDLNQADPATVGLFPNEWYRPSGSTPLYDAIGTGVVTLEATDKLGEDISYLVYILTDGLENASRVYNAEMIKANIARLEATGRWTFIWSITKADFAAAQQSLAFNVRNMHAYENTSAGTLSTATTSSSGIGSYLSARRTGTTASDSFYTDFANQTASGATPPPINTNSINVNWNTGSSGTAVPSVPSVPTTWTNTVIPVTQTVPQPPENWISTSSNPKEKKKKSK